METPTHSFGFPALALAGCLALATTLGPTPVHAAATPAPTADVRPLERFLEQAREAGLPLAFAEPLGRRLQVVWHDADALSPAFFLPPGIEVELLESWLLQGDDGGGEAPPRLMLYGPVYRAPGPSITPPQELGVDAAEYLFHALTQAYLALQLDRDEALAGAIQRRADDLLSQQPPEHRRAAYLEAGAAFVSHLLSVANQLQRSATLHRERGSDLCRHFERPWSLFRLWDAIFENEKYRARWFRGSASGAAVGAGTWVDTGVDLPRDDKLLLVELLLEGAYEGSKEADLAPRFCPQRDAASGGADAGR